MKFIFRLEVKISVSFLPGTGVRGGSDAETVAGAWDFAHINRRWSRHLEVFDRCPARFEIWNLPSANKRSVAGRGRAGSLAGGGAIRSAACLCVPHADRLPERLLPAEYLGRRAWERRKAVLGRTGERLRTFAP